MRTTMFVLTASALLAQAPVRAATPADEPSQVIRALLEQQFSTQSFCVRPEIRRTTLSYDRSADELAQLSEGGFREGLRLPPLTPEDVSAGRRSHFSQLWQRPGTGGYDSSANDEFLSRAEAMPIALAMESLIVRPNGPLSIDHIEAGAIRPPLVSLNGQENCVVLSMTAPEFEGDFAFATVGLNCHEALRCWRSLLFALRRQDAGWRVTAYRIDWARD